jgi:putative component of membrane protein insertase Oxa1/YidC/SpoIIIJ protein YidD
MRFSVCLLLIFLLSAPFATAESAYDVLVHRQEEKNTGPLIAFYQRSISRHDGPRCLFYPTCSAFYDQALKRYGPFWGTLMILDRLMYREGPGSMKYYRFLSERQRYNDPVEHNYILEKAGYYR